MKIETALIIEILAFKIWKVLYKSRIFENFVNMKGLNQSYFSI